MATTAADNGFRERIEQVEHLIQEMEHTADPATKARVQEIVQALLDFHGAGLARVLEYLGEAGESGQKILGQLAQDDLVASMLLLYDMHPLGVEERVRQALDRVRPYLKSHGGSVELLAVHDGMVQLRLQGNCHGCGSSTATVSQLIEQAVLALAPEVSRVEVEGLTVSAAPSSAFISVDELLHKNGSKNGGLAQPPINQGAP